MRKWVVFFKEGTTNVHDEERSGNLRVITDKVSNIIRRHRPIDNMKLLLIYILLLSHSFILFRCYFLSMYIYIFPV